VRRYILFLLEEQQASHSYANQAISAIKVLCNDTLNQGKTIEALPRPKKENKLPNVLSFEESNGTHLKAFIRNPSFRGWDGFKVYTRVTRSFQL
jgi:hypothetical protein